MIQLILATNSVGTTTVDVDKSVFGAAPCVEYSRQACLQFGRGAIDRHSLVRHCVDVHIDRKTVLRRHTVRDKGRRNVCQGRPTRGRNERKALLRDVQPARTIVVGRRRSVDGLNRSRLASGSCGHRSSASSQPPSHSPQIATSAAAHQLQCISRSPLMDGDGGTKGCAAFQRTSGPKARFRVDSINVPLAKRNGVGR